MRELEIRKKTKARKPKFVKQDFHKIKCLDDRWRKPKGLHSKMREKRKGHGRYVEVGYGSPKKVRGLSKDGFRQVLIKTKEEMENLNPKADAIIIASAVGLKRRVEIIALAEKSNIKILNFKDTKAFVKDAEESIKKRKEEKAEKEKTKEKKKEELKKNSEGKGKKEKELEGAVTGDEKKEIEKKEKDKILTKREA